MLLSTLLPPNEAIAQVVANEGRASASEAVPAPLRLDINLVGAMCGQPELVLLLDEWLRLEGIEHEVHCQARLRIEDIIASASVADRVRIWVALPNAKQVRIYFSQPKSRRYLVRELSVPGGMNEVGREQLVQVLLASALAFAAQSVESPFHEVETSLSPQPVRRPPSFGSDEVSGAVPESVVAVADSPRPSDGPPSEPRWTMGAGVNYLSYASGPTFTHGPGGVVKLGRERSSFGVVGRIYLHYRWTQTIRSERVETSLQRTLAAASLSASLRHGSVARWEVEAGGGGERISIEPHSLAAEVTARSAGAIFVPIIVVAAGPSVDIGPVWLRINARLDALLRQPHFDLVSADGDTAESVALDHFEPGILLEFGGRADVQ